MILQERERLENDELVRLKDALWPSHIKNIIALMFKTRVGLKDPMNQTLVDPVAWAFGGNDESGEIDLSGVNWEKVIDFYEYSSFSHARDQRNTEILQQRAVKKYGHGFAHYAVYGPYMGM